MNNRLVLITSNILCILAMLGYILKLHEVSNSLTVMSAALKTERRQWDEERIQYEEKYQNVRSKLVGVRTRVRDLELHLRKYEGVHDVDGNCRIAWKNYLNSAWHWLSDSEGNVYQSTHGRCEERKQGLDELGKQVEYVVVDGPPFEFPTSSKFNLPD